MMVVSWCLAEITRYFYYFACLLFKPPYPLTYLRYSLFMILYPTGILGEILLISFSLPYVSKHSPIDFPMPNRLNVALHGYYVYWAVLLMYLPLLIPPENPIWDLIALYSPSQAPPGPGASPFARSRVIAANDNHTNIFSHFCRLGCFVFVPRAEITRYFYYFACLLFKPPYPLTYLRYSLFMILYPTGILGEILLISFSLPYVSKHSPIDFPMPNRLNVALHGYYVYWAVLLMYLPCKLQFADVQSFSLSRDV
ncbi:hypothetical protein SprV_0501858400 [Sparganum proliferum]